LDPKLRFYGLGDDNVTALLPELVDVSVAHFLLGLVEAELFLEEVLLV